MPLPPEEENGENAANEEPKLQFSYVECLLFSFHQLGKKLPDFLIDKVSAEKLKDFKIRSNLNLIEKYWHRHVCTEKHLKWYNY